MSEIFASITGTEVGTGVFVICILCSLICGVIAAAAASYKVHCTKSFFTALCVLPPIVCTVITMVNGNIGTGVAVMGAFSLVRFRSVAGKARDIVCIFLAMTAGLACAAGYVVIAVLFTAVIGCILMLTARIPIGDDSMKYLKITVPESLDFTGAFDDLFGEYLVKNYLMSVKTTNMGSLYKLNYKVKFKRGADLKKFIDALRCRNGNLEIAVNDFAEGIEEL